MKSKSNTIISAFVAMCCYILPIVLSGIIYVALICNKRKILKNKIGPSDNKLVNSENEVLEHIVSDYNLRETSSFIVNNQAQLVQAVHLDTAEMPVDKQVAEIENDCSQISNDLKVTDNSEITEENKPITLNARGVQNILQKQQENRRKVPVITNCLSKETGLLSDNYRRRDNPDKTKTVQIYIEMVEQNQQINSKPAAMEEDIQYTRNENKLPSPIKEEHKFVKHNFSYNLTPNTDLDEKTEAQVLAAKRSLITNLVLIAQSLVINLTIPFIAKKYLPFYTIFMSTILKGALPICTTIANFSTVATVISQYIANYKN
jgi:hypothetical protein